MQGDWREWLEQAESRRDEVVKKMDDIATLVPVVKHITERDMPVLIEGFKRLAEAAELWREVRRVAKGGQSDKSLSHLMSHAQMKLESALDFLRGVGQ